MKISSSEGVKTTQREHHAASAQFEKYSEDTIYAVFRNYSTKASEVLEDLQLLGCDVTP